MYESYDGVLYMFPIFRFCCFNDGYYFIWDATLLIYFEKCMQLLEPGKHTWLLKTLYGLLMLLPQVCSNVLPTTFLNSSK
jgi:hypothetical protein